MRVDRHGRELGGQHFTSDKVRAVALADARALPAATASRLCARYPAAPPEEPVESAERLPSRAAIRTNHTRPHVLRTSNAPDRSKNDANQD